MTKHFRNIIGSDETSCRCGKPKFRHQLSCDKCTKEAIFEVQLHGSELKRLDVELMELVEILEQAR